MFSKDFAKTASILTDSEIEKVFVAMLDDLLSQEERRISPTLPDKELVALAARIEQLRKLKNYKQYIIDAVGH